jgi:NAD(P)-dependent dehydrogenase (short-subunit alcohol dehydrogenase family)
MGKLENKVAVITGGSGGIGRATAKKMLAEGAEVLIIDVDSDALAEAKNEIQEDKLHIFQADVTKPEEVQAYADEAKKLFGRVDIFFNNAGVEGVVKPLDEYPLETFDQIVNVNIKGVFYGLQSIFPLMKEKGGSVIITSSVAGLTGTPNVLPYVASKHANIGMMRSAAMEGAPHNIRVNTINPSPVDNRMMRSLEEGFAPGQAEAAKKNFEQSIPLGRYGKNEDMAHAVVFLASDESEFITGTVIPVDGGLTAG